jgi:CheY-like chemotaxis protein
MALILVVDDEFGIAKLLQDVLVDEGHGVMLATNGRQALEKAAEQRPDLVITDFMMPVMDGASLVRAFAADPALRNIPVAIMSALPEAAVAARCSGYALFVRKPFRIFDVIDLIMGLLDREGEKSLS